MKLVNVEGSKCKFGIATQYGRFPLWTSTKYEDVEFVNDDGNYRHTGQIVCTQMNYLLQHLDYHPNVFDARKERDETIDIDKLVQSRITMITSYIPHYSHRYCQYITYR